MSLLWDVIDVILVSLLLTWTYFTAFSRVSIVDFELVNVCWEESLVKDLKVDFFPYFISRESIV